MSLSLPDFPWDSLKPYRDLAVAHPGGIIDASVGSPVDATPEIAQAALRAASNAPHYPLTSGSEELRSIIASWWMRRRNTPPLTIDHVLPTIGSKEMVGLLPTILGLGSSDTIVIPRIAYPTYAIGAHVVGARIIEEDDPEKWPAGSKLIWLNTPSNPTGAVLTLDYLARAVARARELGAILVSDECYSEMPWEVDSVPSLLDREVTQGDLSGLLALYSTSKQSNLAGYRAAIMAGDELLIAEILLVRKHLGLIPPTPIQAALGAALQDDEHVTVQKERYRARREVLRTALEEAGFTIDHSEAGLYLWVSRGEDCFSTVDWCARRGILVAPGSFYGEAGRRHVRIALTISDAQVKDAAARLRT